MLMLPCFREVALDAGRRGNLSMGRSSWQQLHLLVSMTYPLPQRNLEENAWSLTRTLAAGQRPIPAAFILASV